METATILNIPNYYSSFYIQGLSEVLKLKYEPNSEFDKWNGFPFIIFEIKGKLVIIDNADPVFLRMPLYNQCDYYFLSNKLKSKLEYQQTKMNPLFPHYPVNAVKLYLKLFGKYWIDKFGLKKGLKEIYIQYKRPLYKEQFFTLKTTSYIFFAGSIWKDEPAANFQRAEFIKACRRNSQLTFEGGMVPRSDGKNEGFEDVLCNKKFTVKQFSNKTSKSLVMFNNPAVLGAISWRVAEAFNLGTPVISLPWQIELPIYPKNSSEIQMIENVNEISEYLDFLVDNPTYQQTLSNGGKHYFDSYCTPEKQIRYILKMMR